MPSIASTAPTVSNGNPSGHRADHATPMGAACEMDGAALRKGLAEAMAPNAPASAWPSLVQRAGGLDALDGLFRETAPVPEPFVEGSSAQSVGLHGSTRPRLGAGFTPAMVAARHNDEAAIERLLELAGSGAHSELFWSRDADGWSALHWAAGFASPGLVRRLAEAVDAHAVANGSFMTPLMVAIRLRGGAPTVEALLPHSDLAAEDRDGHAALAHAALYTPTTSLPLLLAAERADREQRVALATALAISRAEKAAASSEGASSTSSGEHFAITRQRLAQAERFATALLIAHLEENEEALTLLVECLATASAAGNAVDSATADEMAVGATLSPSMSSLASDVWVALALRELPDDAEVEAIGNDSGDEDDDEPKNKPNDKRGEREGSSSALPATVILDVLKRLLARAERDAASPAAAVEQVVRWRDEATARVLDAVSGASASELVALDALLNAEPASPAQTALRAQSTDELAEMREERFELVWPEKRSVQLLRSLGVLRVQRTAQGSKASKTKASKETSKGAKRGKGRQKSKSGR